MEKSLTLPQGIHSRSRRRRSGGKTRRVFPKGTAAIAERLRGVFAGSRGDRPTGQKADKSVTNSADLRKKLILAEKLLRYGVFSLENRNFCY